jgi:hypothetical protein
MKSLKRQNTRLESEGAEFLVLGHLLIQGIPAYKNYINMPGYDLEATNPDKNIAKRISVKSRWTTTATGFIINKFDCDFVVVVKLNRGSRDGSSKVLPPEFYILPVHTVENAPRSKGWNRISFSRIPNFHSYRDRWDLIKKALKY